MVDIPNTGTNGLILKAQGDGSNASRWAPASYTWSKTLTSSQSILKNASVQPITGTTITVSGYSQYFVVCNTVVVNNDPGSSGIHNIYVQIGYGLNGVTPSAQGTVMYVGAPATSGTSNMNISNSLNLSTLPTTSVQFQVFANIDTGATNNGTMKQALLTIIGLP